MSLSVSVIGCDSRPDRLLGSPIHPEVSRRLTRFELLRFAGLYCDSDRAVALNLASLPELTNRLSGAIPTFKSTALSHLQVYLNNKRFSGRVPGQFVERLLAASIEVLYLTGIEINPTAEIPLSSSLCLQYNCMVPPVATPCPLKSGNQKTRPTAQCNEWRG